MNSTGFVSRAYKRRKGSSYIDGITPSHLHKDEDQNTSDDLSSILSTAQLFELHDESLPRDLSSFVLNLSHDGRCLFLQIRMVFGDVAKLDQDLNSLVSSPRASSPPWRLGNEEHSQREESAWYQLERKWKDPLRRVRSHVLMHPIVDPEAD